MKKLVSAFLALIMCLSLAACGGPDKQPAVDAYNQVSETYNEFVDIANESIEELTDEEIEFFNGCADVLNEYADALEKRNDFTQEEIDNLIQVLREQILPRVR